MRCAYSVKVDFGFVKFKDGYNSKKQLDHYDIRHSLLNNSRHNLYPCQHFVESNLNVCSAVLSFECKTVVKYIHNGLMWNVNLVDSGLFSNHG